MGSGGLLPAELGGRVCQFVFLFVCLSVTLRCWHRKPRRFVYALNLGGTGIRPPDSFSYRSNFCSSYSFTFRPSFRFRSRSSSCSTTSGDIFYCSGSRQFNHSYVAARRHICFCFMAKSAFWRGFSALAPYTGVGPIYSAWMKYVVCIHLYIP